MKRGPRGKINILLLLMSASMPTGKKKFDLDGMCLDLLIFCLGKKLKTGFSCLFEQVNIVTL